MPLNPQINYDEDNYALRDINIQETPIVVHAYVPDPADPSKTWFVAGLTKRLVVTQTLELAYTNPASLSLPPSLPLYGQATSRAENLSKVSLSQLLQGKYSAYAAAGMGPWCQTGFEIKNTDGVLYLAILTLQVRSNLIWNTDTFRKKLLPSPNG